MVSLRSPKARACTSAKTSHRVACGTLSTYGLQLKPKCCDASAGWTLQNSVLYELSQAVGGSVANPAHYCGGTLVAQNVIVTGDAVLNLRLHGCQHPQLTFVVWRLLHSENLVRL